MSPHNAGTSDAEDSSESGKPSVVARYVRWLHTRWPAGVVEPLPEANPDGSTRVSGLYVTGDLTGIPLLKFSSDSGARAVQTIAADPHFQARKVDEQVLDLVIIGAGVSGMAAALEAKGRQLRFEVLEASEPFSTVVNFPKAKPIFTYPTEMVPAGQLQFRAQVKEPLVEELRAQTLGRGISPRTARAEQVVRKGALLEVVLADKQRLLTHRVIVGIGRSGNFRKLGVPGEDSGKVFNRLHDPKEFAHRNVLVVGGGDSALETAIAIAECGGQVTLSYRKGEFSRPKPENIEKINRLMADPTADVQVEKPTSERVTTAMGDYMGHYRTPGSIRLMLGSVVREIGPASVRITDSQGKDEVPPNDTVFTMIGREPPLDFFRRSRVPIRGEWRPVTYISFLAFLLFATLLYLWKDDIFSPAWLNPALWAQKLPSLSAAFNDPRTLPGTLKISMAGPAFYYTLAYCLTVVIFGVQRMRRRHTPYIRAQTLSLMAFQCLPLFLLPEVLLPWAGHNGWFDAGVGKWLGDHLFEAVNYGHGRAYWRAYGFVLAFPLNVYDVFTDHPMWLWLVISVLQTFVLIPGLIYFWGKGVYCGWTCSCGALSETLGDMQRQKALHGPVWNRVNMVGQAVLAFAVLLLGLRILGWVLPGSVFARWHQALFEGIPLINYHFFVDLFLAGIVGLGAYFWFSGRVWCRFACPLAALMHIYARFSRFGIIADKKKCISCNICTSVCHQGIDIMNFANKGLPMQDPECVRCSACVQMCPTGVLTFGQVDRKTGRVLHSDPRWLAASPVQMVETRQNGKAAPPQP